MEHRGSEISFKCLATCGQELERMIYIDWFVRQMGILRLELKEFFILILLLEALNESLGLKLVGPYDILLGSFDDVSESDITSYHLHWRYFYDPPEFLTVIKGDDKTGNHLGYYR